MAKWSAKFDSPIRLDSGRVLATLSDARDYIFTLTKAEQQSERWQTAIDALLNAAGSNGNGAWMMLARIGMMRAINGEQPQQFRDEKRTHWRRTKRND